MNVKTLEIGALCAPISTQLAGLISPEDGEALDRHNDAINHCYILGFFDERSTDRARKKLLALCHKAIAERRASLAKKA